MTEQSIRSLWEHFIKDFNNEVGVEPNVMLLGYHREWVCKRLKVLRLYQERYEVKKEIEEIFIKHLELEYRAKRVAMYEVLL